MTSSFLNLYAISFSIVAIATFPTVHAAEMSRDETIQLLRKTTASELEKRYHLQITDAALKKIVEVAPDAIPQLQRPEGPASFLSEVAAEVGAQANGNFAKIDDQNIYQLAAKKMKVAVVPQNRREFLLMIERIKEKLKLKYAGQEQAIKEIGDLAETTFLGEQNRFGLGMGGADTGKISLLLDFGKELVGNDRVLLVAMKAESDLQKQVSDFFAGSGNRLSIVILNQMDPANQQFAQRIVDTVLERQMGHCLVIGMASEAVYDTLTSDLKIETPKLKKIIALREYFAEKFDQPLVAQIFRFISFADVTSPIKDSQSIFMKLILQYLHKEFPENFKDPKTVNDPKELRIHFTGNPTEIPPADDCNSDLHEID